MANATYSDFPERKAVSAGKADGKAITKEYQPGRAEKSRPAGGKTLHSVSEQSGTFKDNDPGYKPCGREQKGGFNRATKWPVVKIAVSEEYDGDGGGEKMTRTVKHHGR